MKFVAIGDCQTGHYTEDPGDYFWSDVVKSNLPNSVLVSRGSELTGWHGWWNRWKEYVLDEKPDVVVVFGGIYHFSFDSDPNSTLREVATKMSKSAKENGIVLVLVSMQPFKDSAFWTEKRQGWLDTFNMWLSEFCSSSGDIFIDAFSLLIEPGTKDSKQEYRYATNIPGTFTFYLNVSGHKVLGELIAKRLAELQL